MRGIEKHFGGVPALQAASLEVEPGEVHALIGQNGAGKSTLIKILTGYHQRDGGEILLEGRTVGFNAPRKRNSPASAQSTRRSTWSLIAP